MSESESDAESSDGSSPRLGSTGVQTTAGIALAAIVLVLLPAVFAGYTFEAVGAVAVVAVAGYALRSESLVAAFGAALLFGPVAFAFWSPALQGLVYRLLVENPGGVQWLVVGVAMAVAGVLLEESGRGGSLSGSLVLVGLAVALLGFLVVGPWVGGLYTQEHLAGEVGSSAETVEQLPDSNASRSRIAPRAVARNWAENSLQYPQYRIVGGDITYLNGTPHWSYALAPSGTVNTFQKRQIGAVYVNQSSTTKDLVIHDDASFRYGQGMALTDSYSWELPRRDYWNKYKDPFVVPHEGDSYIVVPYTEHDWAFRLAPLPQLYSVPKFGGVKVIHEDGTVDDVSPGETGDNEILGEAQNYYPYSLARYRVQSMAFQHGILNTWFGHEDQLEVAPVPGQGNDQPFTVPTEDGIKYFVAAEPWGDASGIYQVWMIDAQTGEPEVRTFPRQSGLRGPRKAVDSVLATDTVARLNDVQASEPIPVVRNDTLYWEVRIVPRSAARITYVAFFDAETEEVTIVETTDGVRAFLAGDRPGGIPGDGDGDGDGDGQECGLYVNVDEDGDGTTDRRVCVPPGGSVSVEQGGNSSDTTTGPG